MGKVQRPRPYDSTRRREQAAQTRMRVIDAAQALFTERGYAATTMEAIATAAGVATDTVYASFGTKRGVLQVLTNVRAAGDDRPIAIPDREEPQAVRAERNQKRQIARFAGDIASRIERARPVDDIIRGAAAVDPQVADLRSRQQKTRYQNLRLFVGWVASNGPLRAGLDEESAAAIVWTMTSPEVHRLFRVERGWSPERYREWLAETLRRTLLL